MISIGQLGEQFVAQWLITQGWEILQQRWRSPWGEIDLIAQSLNPNQITFVEVKTRSRGNWDAGGILAITPHKQAKLTQTANYFLGEHPNLAELPCRFDVALVQYKKCHNFSQEESCPGIILSQPIQWQGYQLTLLDYMEAAF